MTLHPRKPLPSKSPSMQVKLSDTEDYNCEECGNLLFRKTYTMKRVSPLLSPTQEEIMMPVEIFSCAGCGKIPETFLQRSGLEVKEEKLNEEVQDAG